MAGIASPPRVPAPDEQVPLDQIPISPIVEKGDNSGQTAEMPTGSNAPTPEQPITVFHSAEHFTHKHPLMNKWTLWYTKPSTGKESWADQLKEVVTFDSVEEFWGVYNNITKTSDLAVKSDYHLFKAGVRPEWEDPRNKYGGRWHYHFKDRKAPIDELWLHVMLAAIGETLEDRKEGQESEVMGVVVNIRKGSNRIGVWTRTVGGPIHANPALGQPGRTPEEGREALLDVGRRFKEVLGLPAKELVEFIGHTDSIHSGSRARATRFTV